MEFELTIKVKVTEQQLSDLLFTAFEGGINYWCDKVEVIDNPDEKAWASEVLASGGKLKLYDVDSDDTWELTRDNLLSGLKMAMIHYDCVNAEAFVDSHDAEWADVLVQYALFDEIVFV